MRYHFKVHKDPDGIWAECLELEGCNTQSEDGTMENLEKNLAEALNLYLDEPNMNIIFPLPDNTLVGEDIAAVEVEPGIAFAVLLRAYRKSHNLKQKDMVARLGFQNLFSYQRLEGKHPNPRLDTLALIQRKLPDFNVSMLFK
jgi:predicted RNase H-like HicB family nuclease